MIPARIAPFAEGPEPAVTCSFPFNRNQGMGLNTCCPPLKTRTTNCWLLRPRSCTESYIKIAVWSLDLRELFLGGFRMVRPLPWMPPIWQGPVFCRIPPLDFEGHQSRKGSPVSRWVPACRKRPHTALTYYLSCQNSNEGLPFGTMTKNGSTRGNQKINRSI